VPAPADLTQPCDELPGLQQDKTYTLADMVRLLINNAALYNDCKARHEKLSEWTKG